MSIEDFEAHSKWATSIVRSWPEWKQNLLGRVPSQITMNAQEARSIANRRLQEEAEDRRLAFELRKYQETKAKYDVIQEFVEKCINQVTDRAKQGHCSMDISPDYKYLDQIKTEFAKLGYRISSYTTDEGYCNGYMTHYVLEW